MPGEASGNEPAEAATKHSLAAFRGPRYWPVWLLWLWMQLIARVPVPLALGLHRVIGELLYLFPTRPRSIVRRNLALCFPDLDPAERDRLARRHFRAVGAMFAECAIAWCASDRHVKDRFEVDGLEHLQAAVAKGKGVILFTGHFTTLEICGRPFKWLVPRFACMFSHRSNALLDEIQYRGRMRCAHESIPSDRVRAMLASLKRNAVIWYAPDQASHGKNAVPTEFFAEPAMMTTATSTLARISGAAIVPFSYRRIEGQSRYLLTFHPPLEDFPTEDAARDTARLAALLESFVREAPEQYVWTQKKFRGRPGMPDPYAGNDAADEPAPAESTVIATEGPAMQHETTTETGVEALRPAPAVKGAHTQLAERNASAATRTLAEQAVEPKFSVVIPLNNEQTNIRPLVTELHAALEDRGPHEIILVDDGSIDETVAEIRCASADIEPLRLLRHGERRGQSTALYNGVRSASAELVAVMDGDLQNDPADLPRLLDAFSYGEQGERLGMVIGHRTTRRDSGLRRLSSRIANGIRARILKDDTPDSGCGIKVLRKSVFTQLPYFDHMHRFLPALVQAAGYRVASIPVNHRPRVSGKAHYGMWDRLWVGIVDLAGVAWLARRSQRRDYREEVL